MDHKVLIASLKKVIGTEVQTLDQLWQHLEPKRQKLHDLWVKEGSPDTFEEWQQEMNIATPDYGAPGDPLEYFTEIKQIKKPTWVVHFTNANPAELAKKPLKGIGIENLALSKKAGEGSYLFGFDSEDSSDIREGWVDDNSGHKYGNNFLLIKVSEAISVFHVTDGERQLIFTNDEILTKHPGIIKDGYLVINNKRIPARPDNFQPLVFQKVVS